jgi:hypothetical protein
MQEGITITQPVDVKNSLKLRSKIEAISSTELIERAIREYLLVRQSRSQGLRKHLRGILPDTSNKF